MAISFWDPPIDNNTKQKQTKTEKTFVIKEDIYMMRITHTNDVI
jgi:hypothetical protein